MFVLERYPYLRGFCYKSGVSFKGGVYIRAVSVLERCLY